MSARLPGRRTESLFDNRYRYDQIYPRGRSGETLRAYDTQANDRPISAVDHWRTRNDFPAPAGPTITVSRPRVAALSLRMRRGRATAKAGGGGGR